MTEMQGGHDGFSDECFRGGDDLGPLCDIGINLLDDMFSGEYNGKQRHAEDISWVLRRARTVGVTHMILTAGNSEESEKLYNFASNSSLSSSLLEGVYTTVGVHPTRCCEFTEQGEEAVMKRLESILSHCHEEREVPIKRVVAIGECGLDYDRLQFCGKEQQMRGFLKHFDLAAKYQLPMFLHDRNTGGDFLKVMSENISRVCGGVVHSFTGTINEMKAYVDLGLYIGINGCSLKTEENLAVVKEIPLDRILLETDAPWCAIKNTHASKKYVRTQFQSKKKEKYTEGFLVKDRNEPCMLIQVVEAVAGVKEISSLELAQIVWHNTEKLFFSHLSLEC